MVIFHFSKKSLKLSNKSIHQTFYWQLTVELHNRDIMRQNLHINRSDNSIQCYLFLFLLFFSLPPCFLHVFIISCSACPLRPLPLHSSLSVLCGSVSICSGLRCLEDLPPHPKEFHPLYGSLILFNCKWNAGQSCFLGHHITLWHFSLEVCDLYQGAEPSVASANYWPTHRELISRPHSQRPLSRHLGN